MSDDFEDFPDDFGDLDRWGETYTPEVGGRLPGPEVLKDGTYEFEIVHAELMRTKKDPQTIFKLQLKIASGSQAGLQIERPTFFNRQESLDYLGGELVTLGFDADQWGKRGKPWSQELREVCGQLTGMKFLGAKTTGKGGQNGREFHNLYINARLMGRSMPTVNEPVGAGVGANHQTTPAGDIPW